jgi:hypothetical protein
MIYYYRLLESISILSWSYEPRAAIFHAAIAFQLIVTFTRDAATPPTFTVFDPFFSLRE